MTTAFIVLMFAIFWLVSTAIIAFICAVHYEFVGRRAGFNDAMKNLSARSADHSAAVLKD